MWGHVRPCEVMWQSCEVMWDHVRLCVMSGHVRAPYTTHASLDRITTTAVSAHTINWTSILWPPPKFFPIQQLKWLLNIIHCWLAKLLPSGFPSTLYNVPISVSPTAPIMEMTGIILEPRLMDAPQQWTQQQITSEFPYQQGAVCESCRATVD